MINNVDYWKNEITKILEWICRGSSTSRFIANDNGKVNDYLLLFEKEAIQKDFIISTIDLKQHVKLNKFEDVYIELLNHLSEKDFPFKRLTNLSREFEESLIKHLSILNPGIALSLIEFFSNFYEKNLDYANIAWRFIKGEKLRTKDKKKIGVIGKVNKENVTSFFLSMNYLIRRSSARGWVIIFKSLELIDDYRLVQKNQAYNLIRQFLDMQGSFQLKNSLILFTANSTDFFQNIHSYKALAERIYSENDLYTRYNDYRHFIWNIN